MALLGHVILTHTPGLQALLAAWPQTEVVGANFFHEPQAGYVIGFPVAGTWKLRFNSDWQGYSKDFGHPSADVVAEASQYDGLPFHAALSIGPYSVLIFSQ